MHLSRTHRTIAAAACSLAAGAAVPAAAAAAWTAPATISTAHGSDYPLGITNTNTSTIAWWGWQDGAGLRAPSGFAFAQRPSDGGAFGTEHSRGGGEQIAIDVQGYGTGRVLALSQDSEPGPRRNGRATTLERLTVTTGGAAGFGSKKTLARSSLLGAAQLGVAANGRALVAFASYDPTFKSNRDPVSVALRSPGGSFARPSVISGRGQAHGVTVAIGHRGDMVVAFVRNKKVVARVRRPGHGWGSIQTLATAKGPTQWTLRAAVSDAGSVEVLWQRRFVSDRMDGSALQARRMGPGASRWGALQTIEPGLAGVPSELVEVPGGFAVGYTVRELADGARPVARASIIKPGSSRELDVAAGLTGARDVRVAWSDRFGLFATIVTTPAVGDGVAPGVGALLAPGAASFGPLERVTAQERVQFLAPGFGRDGVPIAVWSSPPDGSDSGIPADELRRVVRTSTRTG